MNKVIWKDPKVRFKKHAELMTLRAGRDALRAENEKLNAQVEERSEEHTSEPSHCSRSRMPSSA